MALAVDPTLSLGTLPTLARYQGSREDPLTEEQPGRILDRCGWARRARWPSVAAASTTGRPTRPRCSSRFWGSCTGAGCPRPRWPRSCRPPTARSSGSTPTATEWRRFHRLSAGHRPRPGQPGLDGLLRRDQPGPTDPGRAAHRARRGAVPWVRGRTQPAWSWPTRSATRPGPRHWPKLAVALKAAFNDRF